MLGEEKNIELSTEDTRQIGANGVSILGNNAHMVFRFYLEEQYLHYEDLDFVAEDIRLDNIERYNDLKAQL